jgi:undecaprenyl-diphosphatase
LLCAGLTFLAGIAAIAFLMSLLKRVSFLPFVLYRMMLGGFLLVLLYA